MIFDQPLSDAVLAASKPAERTLGRVDDDRAPRAANLALGRDAELMLAPEDIVVAVGRARC